MCWVASGWFGRGCYGLVNLWFVSVVSFLFGWVVVLGGWWFGIVCWVGVDFVAYWFSGYVLSQWGFGVVYLV